MAPGKKDCMAEKPLTAVMEDYLEAIFDLDKEKRAVRVKDIAKRLDVKMPTVSSMLKTLNDRGLVNYEKYEYVELTEHGADVGKEMRRRHGVLYKFLTEILKIELNIANEEACKMEHALSLATLDSLVDFMEFIQACPRTGNSCLKNFEAYRRQGRRPDACKARADEFACELEKTADSSSKRNSAADTANRIKGKEKVKKNI